MQLYVHPSFGNMFSFCLFSWQTVSLPLIPQYQCKPQIFYHKNSKYNFKVFWFRAGVVSGKLLLSSFQNTSNLSWVCNHFMICTFTLQIWNIICNIGVIKDYNFFYFLDYSIECF